MQVVVVSAPLFCLYRPFFLFRAVTLLLLLLLLLNAVDGAGDGDGGAEIKKVDGLG